MTDPRLRSENAGIPRAAEQDDKQNVLRDRIAYAIAQSDGDEPGMKPASCDYEMADAVIAELGLRRASRPNDYDHVQYPPGDRYITDWLADG